MLLLMLRRRGHEQNREWGGGKGGRGAATQYLRIQEKILKKKVFLTPSLDYAKNEH